MIAFDAVEEIDERLLAIAPNVVGVIVLHRARDVEHQGTGRLPRALGDTPQA
jgi:hypothetical protein